MIVTHSIDTYIYTMTCTLLVIDDCRGQSVSVTRIQIEIKLLFTICRAPFPQSIATRVSKLRRTGQD